MSGGSARHMASLLCLVVLLLLQQLSLCEDDRWMFQSEKKWDNEWSSGAWDYMESVAVERARIAVIGGVLIQMYSPGNSSVLDVGCGEGAIADFLSPSQKSRYVGVDISKNAIQVAKSKRKPPMRFVHASAYDFVPTHKFDVVAFSDVLYYVNYEKVLKQYMGYMSPGGLLIISIFHSTEKLMYENIWASARSLFTKVDEVDVGGFTRKKKGADLEKTSFHVEVYRKK